MTVRPAPVGILEEARRAWVIQRRVIGALIMREMLTRYGRQNVGFLWLFIEPMMFTLGVATIWSFAGAMHGSSLPIVAFALTGYSSVLLWRNMPSRCISAIEPNQTLLYHRHVKVFDFYLARIVLEATGVTISFVILTLAFAFLGWLEMPEDALQVVAGWLMLLWFGAALGLMIGGLAYDNELVERIWHPLAYLMFPLSGAAFLVSALPTYAQKVVLYLPMVNGVEYLRQGFFGSAIRAHYDMGYMAVCNIALTYVGLVQLRRVSKRIIPT